VSYFSVLISVYKGEKASYLFDSLESVFHQSLKPTEVILVKDGELTDELDKVINLFTERHDNLFLFGYSNNRGLGYALKCGLENCRNDIVFRCDSDDINAFDRFEKQMYILETMDVAIVGSNIEEFNFSPGDLRRTREVPEGNQEIQHIKSSRNPFNHMSVAFRKTDVIASGGYIEMPGYEDYYLWLRLLVKYQGYNIQSSLVHARVGNNMISRRQGIEFMLKEFRFQRRLVNDNLIGTRRYLINIFVRVTLRMLPPEVLKSFYNLFLRRKL
jgi:glycosyltransferase involved in cell wall biosynthesis